MVYRAARPISPLCAATSVLVTVHPQMLDPGEHESISFGTYDRVPEALDAVNNEIEELIKQAWGTAISMNRKITAPGPAFHAQSTRVGFSPDVWKLE